MKISTKARYGLRALVDLAVHSSGDQVPLISIAQRQELSANYMEQVFSSLKKAGIVKSIKGSQGGYILAKRSCDITVGEVIRAIEGEILIVEEEEARDNASLIYNSMKQCLQEQVWSKITESICQVIDHITLEDLMKDYEKLNQKEVLMYYI